MVKQLLAGGADINVKDADGNTPLHMAVLFRRSENLDEILAFNPDIDAKNKEGFTPLLLAVQRMGNEEAIKYLIQNGASLDITDPQGRNALLLSVDSNQRGYIGFLVSNGMNINSQDNNGNTVLHYVYNKVLENNFFIPFAKDLAKDLLKEGADPHIKNNEGKSPMDLAVESGEKELIELLKQLKPV